MPRYDVAMNEILDRGGVVPAGLDKGPFPRFNGRCGILVDANGAVVSPSDTVIMTACDTETGEVEHLAIGEVLPDGRIRFKTLPVSGRVVTAVTVFPAPMQYVNPLLRGCLEADPCHRVSPGRAPETISSDPSG